MLYHENLKNQFPNISEVEAEYIFTDPDGLSETNCVKRKILPESVQPWKISCPYQSCINGGFEIQEEIFESVKQNNNLISGRKICQGWQDSRRVGKNRCLCELKFTLKVKYT